MITIKNPHSLRAALKNRPGDIKKISASPRYKSLLDRKEKNDPWCEVLLAAKSEKIPIQFEMIKKNDSDGRSETVTAQVLEKQPVSLEKLFQNIDPNKPSIYLALDCIQDPQNLGSIFRTASFFDIKGILMTEERSCSLTSTVYDVASGGVESISFAIETNLKQAIDAAKASHLWVLGTSEHAKDSLFKLTADRPWLLVLGNEEKGLRQLTQKSCDMMCTIPQKGEVSSLNVSVAAAISISHFSK